MADTPVVPDPSATPPAPANPATPATPATPPEPTTPQTVPYSRLKEEIDKRKEQDTELERLRTEDKKRKDAEALARGDHEKVINELKPKAERAGELEKALTSVVDAEMALIPEARRSLVPDLAPEKKLAYITANRAFLMDAKPANVNTPLNPDGSSPSGGSNQTFTLAQIRDAKFYEANRDAILKAQAEGRIKD